MKRYVYLYHEANFWEDRVWMEVEDGDLSGMVERDYQERLARSDGSEPVERRDPQEILNETSRAIYNSHHQAAIRCVLLEELDPDGDRIPGGENLEETLCAAETRRELYEALRSLTPEQQWLLHQIYWEGRSQRKIAAELGIRENALANRKRRALESLRKLLQEGR